MSIQKKLFIFGVFGFGDKKAKIYKKIRMQVIASAERQDKEKGIKIIEKAKDLGNKYDIYSKNNYYEEYVDIALELARAYPSEAAAYIIEMFHVFDHELGYSPVGPIMAAMENLPFIPPANSYQMEKQKKVLEKAAEIIVFELCLLNNYKISKEIYQNITNHRMKETVKEIFYAFNKEVAEIITGKS